MRGWTCMTMIRGSTRSSWESSRMALDRLLILGCSQKKRPDSGLLPALDRYDGPMFRVLRKFLRECPGGAQGLETYILSAEFGLMPASQPIPNYDRRMTLQQASRLKSQVLACLRRILTEKQYQRLLISVGKDYAVALSDYKWRCLTNVKMTVATGAQGYRQAELYDWLHGEPPPTLFCTRRGILHLRGIVVNLTSEQVFDIARRALVENLSDPSCYQ